jgi:quercetin dioxygenase-like cupin family protein
MIRLSLQLVGLSMLLAPLAASGENVPDAFSVEWQGKHPCEKLYEDAQIRIGRCTFPPGSVHLCHSHPGAWGYVLSGAKVQTRDERGTRQGEAKTGDYRDGAPIPWHEATNIGDTTFSVLIVEKKYQPAAVVEQSVCK